VDAVGLIRRIFIRDATVKNIQIGTDTMIRDDGKEAKVSIIEIELSPS
jgi:DNA-binding protein Alba